MIKILLKLISSFVVGLSIGILIIIIYTFFFTDVTYAEIYNKLSNIGISSVMISCIGSVVALIISIFTSIILHELGHLITALISGFKFVSFRVANYTLLKENGKYKIKKFFVVGTGGQCLTSPPESPSLSAVNGYIAGGTLINIQQFDRQSLISLIQQMLNKT